MRSHLSIVHRSDHIQPLEARQLLSVSLVAAPNSTTYPLYAFGDGVYAKEWSTDGSLFGQRGTFETNVTNLAPLNGGVFGFGAYNGLITRYSGGRESTFSDVALAPSLREQGATWLDYFRVGQSTYFARDNKILRTRGDFSNATVAVQVPVDIGPMVRLGGGDRFCFIGRAGVDLELWVSDGTQSGTSKLRVLGDDDHIDAQLISAGKFCYFGSNIPFTGTTSGEGTELWRTDGTVAGTVKVTDIRPGPVTSSPRLLATLGDRVLLMADDGSGSALWASDGTAAGTKKLSNVWLSAVIDRPVVLGNRLFFFGSGAGTGLAPWVTDGTAAGTHIIRDVSADVDSTSLGNPSHMLVMNGRVYFDAQTPQGDQLFRTDGTEAGTVQLSSFKSSIIKDLAAFNGAVYCSISFFRTSPSGIWRFSDNAISINGYAFDDVDADTGRETNESMLAGVRIYIDANNNRTFDVGERSALTDANGRYAFTGLSAGGYRLRQVPLTGTRETSPSYFLSLVAGDHVVKTFGSVRLGGMISGRVAENTAGIGGFIVFLDKNQDGKRQKSEPVTSTDAGGHYALTGLSADVYTVRVVSQAEWQAAGPAARRVRVKANRVTTTDFQFAPAAAAAPRVAAYKPVQQPSHSLDADASAIVDQDKSIADSFPSRYS